MFCKVGSFCLDIDVGMLKMLASLEMCRSLQEYAKNNSDNMTSLCLCVLTLIWICEQEFSEIIAFSSHLIFFRNLLFMETLQNSQSIVSCIIFWCTKFSLKHLQRISQESIGFKACRKLQLLLYVGRLR